MILLQGIAFVRTNGEVIVAKHNVHTDGLVTPAIKFVHAETTDLAIKKQANVPVVKDGLVQDAKSHVLTASMDKDAWKSVLLHRLVRRRAIT